MLPCFTDRKFNPQSASLLCALNPLSSSTPLCSPQPTINFWSKTALVWCSQRFDTRKRRKMHIAYNPELAHHTTLAHAPAPHKLHPPAPHEKPAPAPPPHPVCTNANARVRSTSRQSGAQIAPRRRGMLSPCLCSLPLWRAALRASRSPPPGSDSLQQRRFTPYNDRQDSRNLQFCAPRGALSSRVHSTYT